jgi:hypothetical protein
MKKICIICNAKISFLKKYKLNKIYKILSKENNVEIFKTEKTGHATVLCKVNINKFDISCLETGGCSVTMKNGIVSNLTYDKFFSILWKYIENIIKSK